MTFSRITCHFCQKSFGQEARFLEHLTDAHGVTDHLQEYLKVHHGNTHPTCECSPECDSQLRWVGWKKGFTSRFVRGHNARIDSAFMNSNIQEKMLKKRREGFESGRLTVWNKGLKKETDERVRQQSKTVSRTLSKMHESGEIVPWQVTDPEKLKTARERSSKTKKHQFETGEVIPWNKGLTKETDSRLLSVSESLKQTLQQPGALSSKRYSEEQLVKIINDTVGDKFTLITPISEYRNKYQKLDFLCVKCGEVQKKNIMMLVSTPRCFNCHPKESLKQLDLYEYVKSLASDAELSNRDVIAPRELDVWVPSANLGIEFNGLYWHSDQFVSQNYHQEKHDACQEKNVTLLSVFEDEWRDKQDIIKGMIKHRLRLDSFVLNARETTVEIIKTPDARLFFDSAHLEGYTRSKVTFVLKDKTGQVVAGLSLREPFHKLHASNIEVARCAVKPDHNVRGWLGKLTKASSEWARSNGYKSMMTYVDSRVGIGGAYVAAGWKIDRRTKSPRFWWTDYENRFNRFKYKADKSRGMTQQEIADEAGVVKIFGCDNFVLKHEL